MYLLIDLICLLLGGSLIYNFTVKNYFWEYFPVFGNIFRHIVPLIPIIFPGNWPLMENEGFSIIIPKQIEIKNHL